MSLALIDGDIVAFRASAGAQHDIDWGDGGDGVTASLSSAVDSARGIIRDWMKLARCDKALLCFSPIDGTNFRRDLTSYKAHRSGVKPKYYLDVIDALAEEWPIQRFPRLEGDDVVGVIHTSPKTNTVAVSLDKDFQTLPGLFLNPVKARRPQKIGQYEADRWWMMQTLMGDPCDGYRGCPGVGPKRAEAVLSGHSTLLEMWEAVVGTYRARGLTAEDALLQARLARILRREDYDRDTGEITLWSPH